MGNSVPTEPIFNLPSRSNLSDADRNGFIIQFGILITSMMGLIAVAFLALAVRQPVMQHIALGAAQGIALIIAGTALLPVWKSPSTRVYLLLVGFSSMMLALAILAKDQVISAALVNLAFGILVSSFAGFDKTSEFAITYSITSSWIISLAGLLVPVEKVALAGIDYAVPSIIGIFVMIYLTLLAMEWITATLRVRLILGSLAIVIIPLFTISSIQSILVQNSVTERLSGSLSTAASQVSGVVDTWLANTRDSISRQSSLPVLANYLVLPPPDRNNSPQEKDVLIGFQALSKLSQDYLVSYGLVDRLGNVVLDTNPAEVGKLDGFTNYYTTSLTGKSYISDIIFDEIENRPYIYITSPIINSERNFMGILRAKYDARIFQFLLEENSNLSGLITYPILVDENFLRIGDAFEFTQIYKTLAPLPAALAKDLKAGFRLPKLEAAQSTSRLAELANTLRNTPNTNFTAVRFNPDDNSDSGLNYVSIARLTNKPWVVLYTQSSMAFTQLTNSQQQTTTLFTVILAGIVGLFAMVISGSLTQPIAHLTKTAERITAGDLSVNAPISNDEVGVLANAFNVMTARLRQFIGELEERVLERTSELAQRNETLTIRSRQVQTISEVARTIASAHQVEAVLTQVTRLVSERFGFYHVGIFLIDSNHEYAVLRAANSEGGKLMLARQHKLSVGQVGIVGYVTGTGLPRIATDVGTDAVFFNNLDLPSTRSEMALPLIGSGEVIGALDVQSNQANAFTQADVELFTTLADQITTAISSSRIFEETQHALEEARIVHQQYLHQEWTREAQEKLHYTYEYTPRGVVARERLVSAEITEVFASGQPLVHSILQHPGSAEPATMGIPIKLRGETIGIIHLQDSNSDREWANEEIETVQSIADQVAQALENARLFEQTVRRAERERKVLEITSKIRSTTDPKKMLQIAVEELQFALHASKTQVILNPVEVPANEGHSSNNGHSNGSNGNSQLTKG